MKTFLLLFLVAPFSYAQTWVHEGQPAQIIELYTSEGCSSCPPADLYLSDLNANPDLWNKVIPMAFHVDYWDYLGWKDPYAQPSFTLRQRLYRKYQVVGSVYTPSFVVDGKEWRGFFNWLNQDLPEISERSAKKLSMIMNGSQVSIEYQDKQPLDLTLVAIANERFTEVKAGENRGKQLKHNFVVLEQHQQRSNNGFWQFDIVSEDYDVLALWVTPTDSFIPLQTLVAKKSE